MATKKTASEMRLEKQIDELREALSAFQTEVKKGNMEIGARLNEAEARLDTIEGKKDPERRLKGGLNDCGLG